MRKPVIRFNSPSELRRHFNAIQNQKKPTKRKSITPKTDRNWLKERYSSYSGEKTTGGCYSRTFDNRDKYLSGDKDFYIRRENGRFGSYSSFDRMDGESFS